MSARVGFTADDAERQAGFVATRYLSYAMRTLAECLALEKAMQRDPAGFADRFTPLLSALIEAQSREFQSWTLSQGLEAIAETHGRAVEDLANVLSDRLHALEAQRGRT